MDKPKFTEKQITALYHQVMTDDTYWDDMNSGELEKRLAAFNEHKKSQNKLISLLSCIRLAPCIYLRERVDDGWSVPVINIPDSPVLTVFSSAEQIKSENFKSFDVADARLPELLDSIKMEGESHIVVNPDTHAVILPLSLVKGMFDIFDDIVAACDEQMAEGVSVEQLDAETFEHFFCRTVVCETFDGRLIRGDAVAYRKTNRGGQGHLKRQENRAVLAWRRAVSTGLVSTADWAYMKAPVPRPTLRLVDKVSRSCGHTPGKVAGQRATVKAEMNGVTPGLDRRPPPRWMGGQGGQSLKVLGRSLSDFGVFKDVKIKMGGKPF